MDYSLAQLRGFVTVAEELHFGRAAERLAMTQPPLTRQIQALERALQVRLFDRGPRGVSLTAAGRTFLADARRVLTLVEAAPESARRVATGQAGTLRLGFTAIGAYAVLGDVLTLLTRVLPGVSVALDEQTSEIQFPALISGTLDLGLVRPPVPDELASVPIHTEQLVIAVPEAHPLAAVDGPVRLSDVSADYIGYSPEGSRYLHDVCAALVGMQDFLRAQIASQVPTMLALVRAGRGFALVPRSCTAMRVEGVVFRELAEARTVSLHACWNPDSTNPVLERLLPHL
ncbi:LysR substrate-binding domain-containing protein [Microlunatus parietis]|uniref:DNA-binding transcriptional LysR family regulator n=1 Tax=Microlunatus parietis TaxID=682979 RepID=A0A7Y9LDN2_9ACTN|nr:LysR substrate-binding domain-containing protein [Microlunatus parietis]NYE73048.1 DNA-binding transcriptional LysR family regulator [Microlunatus parietis]